MMIPPVDEQVLRDNPEFAKLYLTLKNDILNPDGSTRLDPELKDRKAISQVSLSDIFVASSHSGLDLLHLQTTHMSARGKGEKPH